MRKITRLKIITSILLIGISCAWLSACKDKKAGIKFNLSYNSSFTIKKSTIITLPFNLISAPITTNSESEFQKNNTNAEKVIEVKALSGTLSITAPEGATFSFVKDAYLYINADGLSENLVAFKENIANADNVITLDLPSVDLAPYIKAKTFVLRLEVTTDETLTKDVEVNANVLFRVKANPLK